MPPRFLCAVISIFSMKILYCKVCKKYLSNNKYFRHSLNQGQISLGLVTSNNIHCYCIIIDLFFILLIIWNISILRTAQHVDIYIYLNHTIWQHPIFPSFGSHLVSCNGYHCITDRSLLPVKSCDSSGKLATHVTVFIWPSKTCKYGTTLLLLFYV